MTGAVQEEVQAWQSRPLEPLYPIVYMDALYVRMRDNGHVRNRAVYVAIGVNLEGEKEVLGLWTSANEGAKFWLQVLTEMQNRGVEDIFIACVDGLKGFRKRSSWCTRRRRCSCASCIMVRHSLNYVSWKQRRAVAADLRAIYTAPTAAGGGVGTGRVRRQMGQEPSDDQPGLAAELGSGSRRSSPSRPRFAR